MSSFREAIEARIGSLGKNYLDVSEALSTYYGPDSLACYGLRHLGESLIESYFIVPENLCGPKARPPMFDKIRFESEGVEVESTDDDAKQHFIDSVIVSGILIKIIPGHNIVGLIAESMAQIYNQRSKSADLLLTGFDFIRYKGFSLPGQKLIFAGAIADDEGSICFSPKVMVGGQVRAMAGKFRCEPVCSLDDEIKNRLLAPHWLLETTAQGFGSAVSLVKAIDGLVPVLMQCEKTEFAKTPIKAGDLVTTRFELMPSSTEQGFGNAEIFVNGKLYGTQRRLMVQFFSIDKIAAGIENAKTA